MIRFVSISLLTTMFLMSCNSDSERLQKRVNHLEQQLIQCKLELEKTQNPPDKLLQDAKDLAKAKKYSEAIEIFNKAPPPTDTKNGAGVA